MSETIVDQTPEFLYLIEPLKLKDPRLHQALTQMMIQLGSVTREISPIVSAIASEGAALFLVNAPLNPRAEIQPTSLRLFWDWVNGAAQYEVRWIQVGQDWESAVFIIRTNTTVIDITPFKGRSEYYAFKSINQDGIYSLDFTTLNVLINPPKPITTLTGNVIDNNVLLTWSTMGDWIPEPGYYQVDKYFLFRNGIKIGETKASYIAAFESSAGSFEYSIAAVDIAGNMSPLTSITLVVSVPPDYVLEDKRVSDLSGDKHNLIFSAPNKLLGPVDVPGETWQEHFTRDSWLDPEDQVTAGYPLYVQPAAPPIDPGGDSGDYRAYYHETIDYGTVLKNTAVTVQFDSTQIDPANPVTFQVGLLWSVDAISWSQSLEVTSHFIDEFRHLQILIIFYGDDKALAEISNVTILISAKKEVDGGSVNALASDVGGTLITFNKNFQDIDSITVTPRSIIEPLTAIFDFLDAPNPESFRVYVFDSTGMRVDAVVDWKARGIVL